jgi:hypothetical protein
MWAGGETTIDYDCGGFGGWVSMSQDWNWAAAWFRSFCRFMNNNNVPALLRSLIVYGICVPLAIFVGWTLANPLDLDTLGFYGLVGAVLISPIILRWHTELLVFSWFASISVCVLPGAPALWLVMVVVSLTISVLDRIISNDQKFIRVPQVTWPLIAFMAVVIVTAELTGGIGVRALGGAVYGGKKYIYLIISFLSYFAITARAISPRKATLYIALFLLGKTTMFVGDLYPVAPGWMHPLFLIFPPLVDNGDPFEVGVTRLSGVSNAALAMGIFMLARYGVRGIFLEGKLWRPAVIILMFGLIFLGGFRTILSEFIAVFLIMFFLEKLHRTPLMLALILVVSLGAVAIVPLAPKLPFTFQRALAFLPLNLDAEAVASAQDSTEWRLRMWEALLPQIPPHLLLGKGLAFSSADYDEMMSGNIIMQEMAERFDASEGALALSNDFHNGMISLIIPFGIWGVITMVWFIFAGLWVMWRNMKYCRPEIKTSCTLLYVLYLYETVYFVSCIGGLQIATELAFFIGYLGLSIALNNGVCQAAVEPMEARQPAVIPFRGMPRPRPAFQR